MSFIVDKQQLSHVTFKIKEPRPPPQTLARRMPVIGVLLLLLCFFFFVKDAELGTRTRQVKPAAVSWSHDARLFFLLTVNGASFHI